MEDESPPAKVVEEPAAPAGERIDSNRARKRGAGINQRFHFVRPTPTSGNCHGVPTSCVQNSNCGSNVQVGSGIVQGFLTGDPWWKARGRESQPMAKDRYFLPDAREPKPDNSTLYRRRRGAALNSMLPHRRRNHFNGFWGLEPLCTAKYNLGPSMEPDSPTVPITVPLSTNAPSCTYTLSRWAYTV